MAARVHLPTLRDHPRLSETGGALGLIIVGESEPYSRSEIAKALGVSTLGVVANDHRSAGTSVGREAATRASSTSLR